MSDKNLPYCGLCGDRHTGDCNPKAFAYYQCSSCGTEQVMPWDAVLIYGLDGLFCGCGASAEESWNEIEYERYLEIQNGKPTPEN